MPVALGGGFGHLAGGALRYAGALAQLKAGQTNSTAIHQMRTASKPVLVLYDTDSTWGWAGNLYQQMIANLLNRFRLTVISEPVENYQAGQIANSSAVFYIGTTYGDALPAAFKTEVLATTNPVCWIGYNLWQIAWTPDFSADVAAFTTKTGFRFVGVDTSGYPTVQYNGASFVKYQADPTEGQTLVLNSSVATVMATSVNASGRTIPYEIKGGNFYYVADNPFSYILTQAMDRNMVFDDLIHTVVGQTLPATRYATVRIEDICNLYSKKELRSIANILYAEKVPFSMNVIPEYRDPLGYYNNGVAQSLELKDDTGVRAGVNYMKNHGGKLVMHGDTHQYSNVLNPYTGVSADDYEFFRVQLDSNGHEQVVGPVTEDSTAWATGRLTAGLNALAAAGFAKPTGFTTPHYLASPADYVAIKNTFKYSLCRGLYFTTDANGTLYWIQQPIPYPTTDVYGMLRYPEDLGFVDPTGLSGNVSNPSDIISRAAAMKTISGGWASFYFHPYVDPTYLKQCIDGIKALGYTFVEPSTIKY